MIGTFCTILIILVLLPNEYSQHRYFWCEPELISTYHRSTSFLPRNSTRITHVPVFCGRAYSPSQQWYSAVIITTIHLLLLLPLYLIPTFKWTRCTMTYASM